MAGGFMEHLRCSSSCQNL